MNITKFDRKTINDLTPRIGEILKAVADQYGLTVTLKGGNFTDTTFLAKVEFGVKEMADGTTREKADFLRLAPLFYCKPEDYEKVINIGGVEHKLIGFEPKRAKYCIRVRTPKGKTVLYAEEILKRIGRGLEATFATGPLIVTKG